MLILNIFEKHAMGPHAGTATQAQTLSKAVFNG
jgi:hypothetical protein